MKCNADVSICNLLKIQIDSMIDENFEKLFINVQVISSHHYILWTIVPIIINGIYISTMWQ